MCRRTIHQDPHWLSVILNRLRTLVFIVYAIFLILLTTAYIVSFLYPIQVTTMISRSQLVFGSLSKGNVRLRHSACEGNDAVDSIMLITKKLMLPRVEPLPYNGQFSFELKWRKHLTQTVHLERREFWASRPGMDLNIDEHHSIVGFPGWIILIIAILPCMNLIMHRWRIRSRLREGRCLSCGYILLHRQGEKCPECGWTISEELRALVGRMHS